MRKSPNKRVVGAICLLAIAAMLFVLPAISRKKITFTPYGIRYSEKSWPEAGQKLPEARLAVIDDFIARYKLVGLSRARVHCCLGTEGLTTAAKEKLLLDSGNCLSGAHTYLEIEFDRSSSTVPNLQKAVRYRSYKDFHGQRAPEISGWSN